MDWNFSFGWFAFGVAVLIAGTLITVYYQPIANNIAHGVSSYDKTKLFGLITAGVGLLIMANLHTLVLSLFVQIVFKR